MMVSIFSSLQIVQLQEDNFQRPIVFSPFIPMGRLLDLDDPLAGLLSDEEEDGAKKLPPTGTKSSPERHTGPAKGMESR